ncbi:MAG TPA: ATP synthase F1 subunit gamma [Gemmatales bacterium]|nr:ATP synthase F1 subunit gamma [Gemmatales bacterium]
MANLRLLVNRRKAIRNIRKITRTMELIATARFKKAMDRATEAAAYTKKIAELASDLSASAGNVSHPLLEKRAEVKNVLLLVICANRGLCGGYNGSIIRVAQNRMKQIKSTGVNNPIELSGKRAIAFFKFQGIATQAAYTQFEDKPAFEEVDAIADKYLDMYIKGEVDRIDVAYMKFLNPARQTPVVETLIPLDADAAKGTSSGPKVEYEYLPDAADILTELLPAAFKAKLFKCFLDAAVSEQIARRVAMKAATENAGDMIRDLSLKYNRARQAQITKEIAELIGGSEALK